VRLIFIVYESDSMKGLVTELLVAKNEKADLFLVTHEAKDAVPGPQLWGPNPFFDSGHFLSLSRNGIPISLRETDNAGAELL
jgi:hypothetical protein